MEEQVSPAEAIQALVEKVQLHGASTAFQSVAVSAARVLKRAVQYEERAFRAAISLAQQEKLEAMLGELYDSVDAISTALNEQGLRLLGMTEEVSVPENALSDKKETWWFALSEVIHALERDAKWLKSLICGQQPGAPAHELGGMVIGLVENHHEQLLKEAERWMA